MASIWKKFYQVYKTHSKTLLSKSAILVRFAYLYVRVYDVKVMFIAVTSQNCRIKGRIFFWILKEARFH
jgi:hypothetical protein